MPLPLGEVGRGLNLKTMYRIIYTLAFLLAAMVVSAQRQGAWTLRECIDYALENNITVKQQDVTRRQGEVELSTAKNSRLPDLNASASQNWSFGRGLTSENTYSNKNTSSTSLSLGTSVPLFTGLRIPRTIKLNKLNLEAATADLAKARDDVSVQVAQAYVQILYDMELRDVARRQIEIDSMHVARLAEMLRTGKASGVELAQQEAALVQSRLTYTQADNDCRLAVLSLAQLLELPSPEGFAIVRPDTAAIDMSEGRSLPAPDEIYQEALAFKPEIRAEMLRLKGAEVNVSIAKSALLPTLSLNAGLGSNYYKTSGFDAESFGRQMRNNFSQYIGLSLNVPIFNRLETRNSIRAARLSRETQQLQLENVKKTLYKEIQQAYYNAVAACAQYASSREASRSNKAAFDLTSAKYEYGKAGITEFNEAKNNWLKAESDLVRAKYEYMYSTGLLDFYRGKPIDF